MITHSNCCSCHCQPPLKLHIQCCCCCHETPPDNYSVHLQRSRFATNDVCEELRAKTQVDSCSVLDGLLRHNSQLTKYLSKYQKLDIQEPTIIPEKEEGFEHKPNTQNIVKDYNLKILPRGLQQNTKESNQKQQQRKKPPSPFKEYNSFSQQTSPRGKDAKHKDKEKEKGLQTNKDRIKGYINHTLAKESRYLSDTAFRKYFQRQCFHDYGRNNTTGAADGLMYKGYLKTHSINPHTGCNMPQKEETYEHALLAGNLEGYRDQKGELLKKKEHIHEDEGVQVDDLIRTGKLIEESEKYHKEQEKYKHLKLVSPKNQTQGKIQVEEKPILKDPTVNLESKRVISREIPTSEMRRQGVTQLRGRELEERDNRQMQSKETQSPRIKETTNSLRVMSPISAHKKDYLQLNKRVLTSEEKNALLSKKNEIIKQCFENSNLTHSIQGFQQHMRNPCYICMNRHKTHCCCVNS